MPKKWVESIQHPNEYQGGVPPRPISPLPKSPITRKSPLEKVDPGSANLTYSRRVAEKRSKSAPANPQSTPNKKQRPDQTDEVDLVNDPMDISLEQPCDFLFAPVDKQYQHVQFSPPTRICPVERLSDSESDSEVNSKDDEMDENEKASSILLDIYDLMSDNNNNNQTEKVTEDKKTSEKGKVKEAEKKSEGVIEEQKETEKAKVTEVGRKTKKETENKKMSEKGKVKENEKKSEGVTEEQKETEKAKVTEDKKMTEKGKVKDVERKTDKVTKEGKKSKNAKLNNSEEKTGKVLGAKKMSEKAKESVAKEKTEKKTNETGKTRPKESKTGKTPKLKTAEVAQQRIPTEVECDTRRVNLTISCESRAEDSLRGDEDLYFTQRDEVNIPGTMVTSHKRNQDSEMPGLSHVSPGPLPVRSFQMDEADCRGFIGDDTRIRHPTATSYRNAIPKEIDMPEDLKAEVCHNMLRHLQRTQEEAVILRVGGRDFHTSMVTLRADPTSLFAGMMNRNSPFRPCGRSTYYIDRDPSHFRLILNYLRGGAHIEARTLPSDERYLCELLVEARFYMCDRLQEIIQGKLREVTGSREPF